jgi:NAD(P)-dependent dehydrogenase (short-subunit alcohol dehydrogenase family)
MSSAQAAPVWQTTPEDWQRAVAVNLGGVVNGLRAFVPRLLAAGRSRRILITASPAGLATWPGGAYAASKHAAVAVAEQAALALADTDVSVSVLCPALVRTGMSEVGQDPAVVASIGAAGQRRGPVPPGAGRVDGRGTDPERAADSRAAPRATCSGIAPLTRPATNEARQVTAATTTANITRESTPRSVASISRWVRTATPVEASAAPTISSLPVAVDCGCRAFVRRRRPRTRRSAA